MRDLTDDKWTLVTDNCRQIASHWLNQCWLNSSFVVIRRHQSYIEENEHFGKYFQANSEISQNENKSFGGVHIHGDVIKWKHFSRYWPFVWGIHRPPVNSPPKGQWRGALMFSLICAWINDWVNNSEADDLVRHRAHYDITVRTSWNRR